MRDHRRRVSAPASSRRWATTSVASLAHADRTAASAADGAGALAYTIGRDIVFGVARYAPHRRDGARLLPTSSCA